MADRTTPTVHIINRRRNEFALKEITRSAAAHLAKYSTAGLGTSSANSGWLWSPGALDLTSCMAQRVTSTSSSCSSQRTTATSSSRQTTTARKADYSMPMMHGRWDRHSVAGSIALKISLSGLVVSVSSPISTSPRPKSRPQSSCLGWSGSSRWTSQPLTSFLNVRTSSVWRTINGFSSGRDAKSNLRYLHGRCALDRDFTARQTTHANSPVRNKPSNPARPHMWRMAAAMLFSYRRGFRPQICRARELASSVVPYRLQPL